MRLTLQNGVVWGAKYRIIQLNVFYFKLALGDITVIHEIALNMQPSVVNSSKQYLSKSNTGCNCACGQYVISSAHVP